MWRVNHFDVSADEPERAVNFYKEVFGWKFEKWKGPFDYWLIMTGNPKEPGIDGGIAKRGGFRLMKKVSDKLFDRLYRDNQHFHPPSDIFVDF